MPLTRIALIVSAVFLLSLFAFTFMQGARDTPPEVHRGEALIGGPFTLVDDEGTTVTPATYGDKLLLVYFGFTYCPDICPTELTALSTMLDGLSVAERAQIQPLFVTVDPARDTPAALSTYLENFHPDFVGLTGSPAQVSAALASWRIYWAKVDDPSSTAGFTYDHSALTYLMDADNQYLAHFSYGTTPEKMQNKIRSFLSK
ncbi:MAG: SCO family protein [Alphaproteobacteria bacterium]